MNILRVGHRDKRLLVAALLHRLEFWRQSLRAGELCGDAKVCGRAARYMTEYTDLLSILSSSDDTLPEKDQDPTRRQPSAPFKHLRPVPHTLE